jgi:hypothetical protein
MIDATAYICQRSIALPSWKREREKSQSQPQPADPVTASMLANGMEILPKKTGIVDVVIAIVRANHMTYAGSTGVILNGRRRASNSVIRKYHFYPYVVFRQSFCCHIPFSL